MPMRVKGLERRTAKGNIIIPDTRNRNAVMSYEVKVVCTPDRVMTIHVAHAQAVKSPVVIPHSSVSVLRALILSFIVHLLFYPFRGLTVQLI
jgi:hypothetical protein